MVGVVSRLGDRLLQRLVPKTTASACEGASAQAEWWEPCFCGDWNSAYPCQVYGRICGTCAGTSYCTTCNIVSTNRCC